jgi:Mrp family chromosome partitioning ATPase
MRSAESLTGKKTTAEADARATPGRVAPPALEDAMCLLHQRLDARLSSDAPRVIQFTAALRGEGTSTIVRAYAQTLARTVGASVLVVDANALHPEQGAHLGAGAELGWDEALASGEAVRRAIVPTACPNLSVAALTDPGRAAAALLDHARLARAFAALRQAFQVVLVDSSPMLHPGAAALARIADGVVLVVEAERTRWPVAARARDAIEHAPATLLGIVLNRRRYCIPRGLYPRR